MTASGNKRDCRPHAKREFDVMLLTIGFDETGLSAWNPTSSFILHEASATVSIKDYRKWLLLE